MKNNTTNLRLIIIASAICLLILSSGAVAQTYKIYKNETIKNPNPQSGFSVSKKFTYIIPVNTLTPQDTKKYISNMTLNLYPQFYESEYTYNKVDVFILTDVSLSMIESKRNINTHSFNDMIQAVKNLIDLIINKHGRVGLIEFSTKAIENAGLSKNSRVLDEIVKNYYPINGTNIEDALNIAINALKNDHVSHDTEKAIVLLSDGKNDKGSGPCLSAAKKAKESNIPIYTISYHSYGGEPDKNLLTKIATTSGGATYQGNKDKIKEIFNNIGTLLTSEKPKNVVVFLNNIKLYSTSELRSPLKIQIPKSIYKSCYDVNNCPFNLTIKATLNMSKINTSLNITLKNAEVCDNKDDNNDGITDNGLGTYTKMYIDNDYDGFGNNSNSEYFCINQQTAGKCIAVPEGKTYKGGFSCKNITYHDPGNNKNQYNGKTYINLSYNQKTYVTPILEMFDCNDHLSFVHPGAKELCDGRLDSCQGQLPENEKDKDKDGYLACSGCNSIPKSDWITKMKGCNDCNDNNPNINPGETEGNGINLDDTIDNNCNGRADYGITPYKINPTSSNCFINNNNIKICSGTGNWRNPSNPGREQGTISRLKVKVTVYNADKNNEIIHTSPGEITVYAIPFAGDYPNIAKLPLHYFESTSLNNGYYDINLNRYWKYTVQAVYSRGNYYNDANQKITINEPMKTINIPIYVSTSTACKDDQCGVTSSGYCGCYVKCNPINNLDTYANVCNGKLDGTEVILKGDECPRGYPNGCMLTCCSGGISPLPPLPQSKGLNFTNTSQAYQLSKVVGYVGKNIIIKIILLK